MKRAIPGSSHCGTVAALALALPVSISASFLCAENEATAESASQAASPPTLTTALQAHSLSSAEAARGYPIHLKGVVTYFDPNSGSGNAAIFVHDSTGSVFVRSPSDSVMPLPPGTLVDVRGFSGPGGFGPIVVKPSLHAIGHSHLPPNPPRESLSRLETGAEDAQWVEVEGTIQAVWEYSHSVTLRLAMEGGTVSVSLVREQGATYSGLVDTKVRIDANAGPTINSNNQMIGVHLLAPNLSAVSVVEPAPADPFKRPPVPIKNLLHWDLFAQSFHRLHLRGVVTLQWPGSALCIQDATGGICVQTDQNTVLALGEEVDVAGFAAAQNDAPVLTGAVFTRTGRNQPVLALSITADEALSGKHDSEPIQIDGELAGFDHTTSDTTLLLSSGKTLFTAVLPKSMAGSDPNVWKVGSKLRIAGVCSVRLDAQSNAREGVAVSKSFRVLMRSPKDVAVLEPPSWWTPDHALVLLACVLTGTLAVLAWVVVLRRRVELQANLLRESEERFRHMALHDALTGLATRMVLQDRLGVALERAKRHHTGLGLLMLDLDGFKGINDTLGHLAGDEVLRTAANRLTDAVRSSDTVVRMGGDEFVVLLTDLAGPHAAGTVAANMVAALAQPVPFEGVEVPISVSIGVCTSFTVGLDAEALLRQADAALYSAKAHGRNCLHVFAIDADSDAEPRQIVEARERSKPSASEFA